MSDIKHVSSGRSFFRVPVHGLSLNGWAVQYISGRAKELPDVEPGFWLTQWEMKRISDELADATFRFEATQEMCFEREVQAKIASEFLHTEQIETRIVKVGHPSPEFEDRKRKMEDPCRTRTGTVGLGNQSSILLSYGAAKKSTLARGQILCIPYA